MTIATDFGSEVPSLHSYAPLMPPSPPANAMISQSVRRYDEVTMKAGCPADWHCWCAMIPLSYFHVIVLRPWGEVESVEQFRMAFSSCCTITFCGCFVMRASDSEITASETVLKSVTSLHHYKCQTCLAFSRLLSFLFFMSVLCS